MFAFREPSTLNRVNGTQRRETATVRRGLTRARQDIPESPIPFVVRNAGEGPLRHEPGDPPNASGLMYVFIQAGSQPEADRGKSTWHRGVKSFANTFEAERGGLSKRAELKKIRILSKSARVEEVGRPREIVERRLFYSLFFRRVLSGFADSLGRRFFKKLLPLTINSSIDAPIRCEFGYQKSKLTLLIVYTKIIQCDEKVSQGLRAIYM